MGKGDKKSKRGKIIRGTYGVRRRRKIKKSAPAVVSKVTAETVPAASPEVIIKPAKAAARTAKPGTASKTPAKHAAKTAEKETRPAASKGTKTVPEKETGTVAAKSEKPAAKPKKTAPKKEE